MPYSKFGIVFAGEIVSKIQKKFRSLTLANLNQATFSSKT